MAAGSAELAPALRARTGRADAVLDLVGIRTVLDSLRIARYGGRVAIAGFLGGGGPIAAKRCRRCDAPRFDSS